MPESNTPNSTDGPGDEGSQNPQSPPKLRFSLRKPAKASGDQVPEEKPPPPAEPEKAEEPKQETPASESVGGGKLKLSLGPKKVEPEPPKEKEEKSEEEALAADPFDIKPKPVEGGPSIKLGIKPKAPAAEEKPPPAATTPATPPPARKKKKSGITIRGRSTQPFAEKDSPGIEINEPSAPVADDPVTESESSPPVVEAPPPASKAPPPPGKKKPVPATASTWKKESRPGPSPQRQSKTFQTT